MSFHVFDEPPPEVGRRSRNIYWDRENAMGGSGHAWFGSQPGSKILAVSACMPRFEAVLADAEAGCPRVALNPQIKTA